MLTNSFEHLESRLEKLASPGIVPGLARLRILLPLMGNPQDAFPAVHVVGTNGKGSTCAALSSIFTQAGYETALYTSPHLVSFGERLEIAESHVAPKRWLDAADRIESALASSEELRKDRPTYFELITAAAFFIIAQEKPDVAIIEAGLGGRFDATNTLSDILITLITPIGIDHTDYLGDSISQIAAEKFAVMRQNAFAIFAGGEPSLEEQFKKEADAKGSLSFLLRDLCAISPGKTTLNGTDFSVTLLASGEEYPLHTPLIGLFQPQNAALALSAALLLRERFPKLNENAIKQGIEKTKWEGRIEKIADAPALILDGAHNPHAMEQLVKTLLSIFPSTSLNVVLGVMADKDIGAILGLLKTISPNLYCTEVPNMPRSMRAHDLAEEAIAHGFAVAGIYEDPINAIDAARSTGMPTVCCGSLYLIGWIKGHLGHAE